MNWTFTSLGVALIVVVIASAAFVYYRRYHGNWQWKIRNVCCICEEWHKRLSWLWAPREEKVGLVKAQHPTAQTILGLHCHSDNTPQNLLHSDSDIKLDAQGGFTRFEAVDRDLHSPLLAGNTIPPQPLRPAPQPRSTIRPRPSPLQAPHGSDYLKMSDGGNAPLTPPPPPQKLPTDTGPMLFRFPSPQAPKNYERYDMVNRRNVFSFGANGPQNIIENVKLSSYYLQDQFDMRMTQRDFDANDNANNDLVDMRIGRDEFGSENGLQYLPNGSDGDAYPEDYVTYEENERQRYSARPYEENKHQRGKMAMKNSQNISSITHQMMANSFSGSDKPSNGTCNAQNNSDRSEYGIEMISVDKQTNPFPIRYFPEETQGYQRVSHYLNSLPDGSHGGMYGYEEQNGDHDLRIDLAGRPIADDIGEDIALSPLPPPPPAPPDPSNDFSSKSEPTTGEKIFNALRSVSSLSYIDASEFYNSVLSTAHRMQQLTAQTKTLANKNEESLIGNIGEVYEESDMDADASRHRGSDLYNAELNMEAQRTAQEVYNSLQDPPTSPLLVKDNYHGSNNYICDPSMTRTSEDILNSIEQKRRSMERLDSSYDFPEIDILDFRRKNSKELHFALEEVQRKRRLSQSLEESFITSYAMSDPWEYNFGTRRGSQSSELDLLLDETNLKRAISCESVCSDTSVVLNDIDDAPVVGHICVGIEQEKWGVRGIDDCGDLAVSVLEARDLVTADSKPAQDTFARVCLLPDKKVFVQTRLCRGCPSPSYQEKFLFPLDGDPASKTLLVEVLSDETNSHKGVSLIGQARLKLGPTPRVPATTWLPLIGSAVSMPQLGELLFSLSYLPTAERLTLVVVKARNLRGTNDVPGDFYVKVYLLQHGKKLHKKRTIVKKGEKSPIFNEAMIFNVTAHSLQTVQLRLTVSEVNGDQNVNSKAYSVGHVIVGASTFGRPLAHWRQMLNSLRRPVAMWHSLRK